MLRTVIKKFIIISEKDILISEVISVAYIDFLIHNSRVLV